MGEWREYDTTADTGLEIWGNNLPDLFTTAGLAFTELTTDPSKLKQDCTLRLAVDTRGHDLQLRDFLDELLYALDVEDLLPMSFRDFKFATYGLECWVTFGKWIDGVHESRTEIKAVTYHELEVKILENGVYYGRVIFDI